MAARRGKRAVEVVRATSKRTSARVPKVIQVEKRAFHRGVKAGWDAAQTTLENQKHWRHADGLSADTATTPEVRRTLRNRARYEVANNTYARGIVSTLANYSVGTGPRLQVQLADRIAARDIESKFQAWADAVGLARILWTMRVAQAQDGEVFAQINRNEAVNHEVQLDVTPIEADRVAEPYGAILDPRNIDGILFDEQGNRTAYKVLKYHPGDMYGMGSFDFDTVRAQDMVHLYRQERPGQHRGVSELAAALPLFAQLRRYTLAVLGAAETAANVSGVIYSDGAASGEADEAEPFEPLELERNMWTTLPYGWKMGQMQAEQPTTTYSDFKKQILAEIARCLNMPFNIAAGDSSGMNYASGRMDHQMFVMSILVDRAFIARSIIDPIFQAWLREAVLIEGYLPQALRSIGAVVPHRYLWDSFPHVDPLKEAQADEVRLRNNMTTLADIYAEDQQDWELQLKQREIEVERTRKFPQPPGAPQGIGQQGNGGGDAGDGSDG